MQWTGNARLLTRYLSPLGHLWQMRCSFGIERDTKEKAETEEDRWLREAEELLAAQVAMYLRGLTAQLENLFARPS